MNPEQVLLVILLNNYPCMRTSSLLVSYIVKEMIFRRCIYFTVIYNKRRDER